MLAAVLAALVAACAPPPEAATVRVSRRDFVHRVRAEGTLVAERATSVVVPPEVQLPARIAWLAEDGIEVEAGQPIVRFDDFEMSRRLEQGRADFESSRLKITKAKAEGESQLLAIEGDRQLAELELDVAERFQMTDEEVFSRFEILESAIDGELAAERKERAEELAGIHADLAATERDLLEIEQGRAGQRIDEARAGLRALDVRAPHAGFLTWNRDWRGEQVQVGQQVWRGQPLAQIPEIDRMKAEVAVLEADAGGLEVGGRATLRIEAHPEEVFAATVRRVDTVARPRQRGSPIQYFGVELELERTDPARMRPGQRVVATLVLAERRDVLVLPRQAVVLPGARRENGRPAVRTGGDGSGREGEPSRGKVWVREGRELVEREVELGLRSAALVVIESGLEEGEVVALEPPHSPEDAPATDRAGRGGRGRVET
jgi:biotin carboxyl carrier protein